MVMEKVVPLEVELLELERLVLVLELSGRSNWCLCSWGYRCGVVGVVSVVAVLGVTLAGLGLLALELSGVALKLSGLGLSGPRPFGSIGDLAMGG